MTELEFNSKALPWDQLVMITAGHILALCFIAHTVHRSDFVSGFLRLEHKLSGVYGLKESLKMIAELSRAAKNLVNYASKKFWLW